MSDALAKFLFPLVLRLLLLLELLECPCPFQSSLATFLVQEFLSVP